MLRKLECAPGIYVALQYYIENIRATWPLFGFKLLEATEAGLIGSDNVLRPV